MSEFEEVKGISQAWVRNVPRFYDHRGFFSEEFRKSSAPNVTPDFVQDSLSYSEKNVLRGMHLQVNQWQLVTLIKGALIDVLIDLMECSPTYLESVSLNLSESEENQLLLGPGIAHGYGVLSEDVILHYKSSVYYGDTPQFGLNWISKELDSHWPKRDWVVSERDSNFPVIQDLTMDSLFKESLKITQDNN
jgi:dTDP-4-dehydrorhamnose 3,5-epimerase